MDVKAQWANVSSDGRPQNIYVTYKGDVKSELKALIHWSWEKVEIDLTGMMGHANGGAFIHCEALKDYPGHPTKFPSEEGWFNYNFEKGGEIRIGLFFEGNVDELVSLQMFEQIVEISSLISTPPVSQ